MDRIYAQRKGMIKPIVRTEKYDWLSDLNEKKAADLTNEIKDLCSKHDISYIAINRALYDANIELYEEMLKNYIPQNN
ncbi:hypothetical protein HCA89_00240 [Listeria innocua]|uniref:Uncharacterized protein n=1 Tax=Listeria innocua TaxID=1642 RepID=A0AB73H4F2_LISIO|nr:hypothetical protein [Listeria innocua]MBC2140721.1 hypothetical protein [Listeria innocua]